MRQVRKMRITSKQQIDTLLKSTFHQHHLNILHREELSTIKSIFCTINFGFISENNIFNSGGPTKGCDPTCPDQKGDFEL